MRVAVTGASGFVGTALSRTLAERGHEVRPLDRGSIGDLADVADWSRHLAGMDAVVHLGGIAHTRGFDEQRLRQVNVEASLALGRSAAGAGVRMVFMSTIKVLGEETGDRPFTEKSTIAPRDPYARAKAIAEQGLRDIAGLRLCVLRPPLVYGPGVRANFLALVRAIAGGWPLPLASIRNSRSLIGVGNLAHAVARCLESPSASGKTFLVTDGPAVSTPDLCRAIGEAAGRSARLVPCPLALLELAPSMRKLTRSLVADDSEIRRVLGWQPPGSFEEELRRTAAWFRRQGG
jgi:nucleoside-diphosphate-sugar epimerase